MSYLRFAHNAWAMESRNAHCSVTVTFELLIDIKGSVRSFGSCRGHPIPFFTANLFPILWDSWKNGWNELNNVLPRDGSRAVSDSEKDCGAPLNQGRRESSATSPLHMDC
ncbi:TPX2 (targeting protein for Xklp2) proteinfamily [Striga asiatica]|uniref:TPX2 (Targeting protein for Xklp2) proteinfamily n=1 Tax=Striga asiatica TaxID=4170 RepID=A0A5A7QV82_STRAF|nr:TPX2 (targeting protein for Xklp2) proteinfamily [Striga asiatica]